MDLRRVLHEGLGPVAMMDVPVDDQHALHAMPASARSAPPPRRSRTGRIPSPSRAARDGPAAARRRSSGAVRRRTRGRAHRAPRPFPPSPPPTTPRSPRCPHPASHPPPPPAPRSSRRTADRARARAPRHSHAATRDARVDERAPHPRAARAESRAAARRAPDVPTRCRGGRSRSGRGRLAATRNVITGSEYSVAGLAYLPPEAGAARSHSE